MGRSSTSENRLRRAALIAVCLLGTGCSGLRLHQPEKLAQAKSAQKNFQAAALDKTTNAERKRLGAVLEDELELVREHTLARRDARLLHVIGGSSDRAWTFLEDEIKGRVKDLGLTMEELDQNLQNQAEADVFLDELLTLSETWETQRAITPDLPVLQCPQTEDLDRDSLTEGQKVDVDGYVEMCGLYLEKRDGALEKRPVNRLLIDQVRTARKAAKAAAAKRLKTFKAARKAYKKALSTGDATQAEKDLLDASNGLKGLAKQIGGLAEVDTAKKALAPLGLAAVVSDLGATAKGALAEAEQGVVLDTLAAALETESGKRWLAPKLAADSDAVSVATSLAALGSAVATDKATLDSKLLAVEQLELDRKAAKKRLTSFNRMLKLLAAKEAAYRAELVYLGEAESLRREIRGELAADPACAGDFETRDFFATPPKVAELCRDRVFRLLVAYSNSWTLGRVEQEMIDYRLIALQHEAALDSSEIAFARWQSLLEISVDQLVALEETGLRSETLTDIASFLGLGAIAAGVN